MIHFLGGLILAIVALWLVIATLSHPAGRAAVLLILLVGGGLIAALIGGNQPSRPIAAPVPPEVAARQREAAEVEAQQRRTRIPLDKISVRDLRIEQFGSDVLAAGQAPGANESSLSVAATVHNASSEFSLVGFTVAARLYDCPGQGRGKKADCEVVQEVNQHLWTEVPPGQTRSARSREFTFRNLPRPRGRLLLDYEVTGTDALTSR